LVCYRISREETAAGGYLFQGAFLNTSGDDAERLTGSLVQEIQSRFALSDFYAGYVRDFIQSWRYDASKCNETTQSF